MTQSVVASKQVTSELLADTISVASKQVTTELLADTISGGFKTSHNRATC